MERPQKIQKRGAPEISPFDYGKLPPQAKDIEKSILGAILTESDCMASVVVILKTEDVFYVESHKLIYKAMRKLFNANQPIDLETVTEELKKAGELDATGGPFYVAQCSSSVGSSANVETWARIVLEKYIQRQIITTCSELTKFAYEDTTDVFDLLGQMGVKFDKIQLFSQTQSIRNFAERVKESMDALRRASENGYITGITTCSNNLDRQLMGFQPTDLVVIAARPGMGKTSIILHILKEQAKRNIPIGLFSLEMNDRQLINKMFSSETNIDLKTVRKGGLTHSQWQQLDAVVDDMIFWPVWLDDTGALDIQALVATARLWVRKHGVKIIYIDYIQLITTSDRRFGNREQEVSHISSKLKALAKELQIPVIVLSQLSRGPESRPGKRAMLSDLRESGAIEQDADIVIFPFRPEYYGIETSADNFTYPKGYTELDIAKFRNGEPGIVRWVFDAPKSRFIDYSEDAVAEQEIEYGNSKLKKLNPVTDDNNPF